uniref:Secreted protein n=1 Tax=Steinernema glaseri TaxID=37863 RepID=A0A1I7Z0U0_9BILA
MSLFVDSVAFLTVVRYGSTRITDVELLHALCGTFFELLKASVGKTLVQCRQTGLNEAPISAQANKQRIRTSSGSSDTDVRTTSADS